MSNQSELDDIWATLQPGVAGKQNAGEVWGRIFALQNALSTIGGKIDQLVTAVAALPKTAANVTLTDAQLASLATQIADQVAAKLPAAPSKDDIAAAVMTTYKSQINKP